MLMRICIYCREEKADGKFNREHVLSQGFGKFEDNLTLGDVCRSCNKTMGDTIETPAIRGSVEGIHRFHTEELRDPQSFAKTPRNRVTFERQEPGWEGVRLFVHLSDDGDDVVEELPPQVRITYKDGRETIYLLADLPETGIDKTTVATYRIYGSEKDDLIAVAEALAKRGLTPKWQEPVEQLPSDSRISVAARAVYDDLSRRVVAKISFNYLASVMGANFVLKPEFDEIRRFIRYGEGRGAAFVQPTDVRFLQEERETPGFRATEDHFVAISHLSTGPLVGHVSIFNMIHNEIVLSRTNPEKFYSGLIPAGSRFSWRERTISPILHVAQDNLVQPPRVLLERILSRNRRRG
jgi:hypothetical protein